MRGCATERTLAALLFIVPLTSGGEWQVITYQSTPGNVSRFSEQGLEIRVMDSASSLIYRLPTPMLVRRLRARGTVDGTLNVPAGKQGKPGFDDYVLRLGLVEAGDRRLGFFGRRFAPGWVRKLFSLAPPDAGISQVRFFNLGLDPGGIGQKRRHPLSSLLQEEVVATPMRDGRFDLQVSLDTPIRTLALWITADGDDTGSHYVVVLEALELES